MERSQESVTIERVDEMTFDVSGLTDEQVVDLSVDCLRRVCADRKMTLVDLLGYMQEQARELNL